MAEAATRGRDASSPGEIPWLGWRDILIRVWQSLNTDHVSVVSAGVAFYTLLSIFPAIGALVSIAGLFMEPTLVEEQLSSILSILPENAAGILQAQAQQIAAQPSSGLGIAALIALSISVYGASKSVRTLMEGMNIAYHEEEKRSIVRLYLVSIALTFLLTISAVIALAATVALPALIDNLGLSNLLVGIVGWIRWPILAILTIWGLAVLYRFGPSRETPQWRWVTWGSVVATLLWIAGSIAFSLYVRNFGTYNESYGTLGGVIILLTWLWLSAFIVLLGAEINSEMEHQTSLDTTTGHDKPMGERGAVVADRIGSVP